MGTLPRPQGDAERRGSVWFGSMIGRPGARVAKKMRREGAAVRHSEAEVLTRMSMGR